MTTQTEEVFFNRRNLVFHTDVVEQVLPEYFQRDYPNLIKFMNAYYSFMDSDELTDSLKDLYAIRDIESSSAKQLDQIFAEIAKGASASYFADSREALRNFANFFRVKGSLYSAEGFFRAFFNETVEIQFPKEQMFRIDDSLIGAESLKYIQNAGLYQVFSILIKSSVPIIRWKELYRRFVHPAGFFLGGEVSLELQAQSIFDVNGTQPTVLLVDSASLARTSEAFATLDAPQAFHEIIGEFEDGVDADSDVTRARFVQINRYATMSIEELINSYGNFAPGTDGILDVNSPTLDEDSGRTPGLLKISNAIETMDLDRFELYDS